MEQRSEGKLIILAERYRGIVNPPRRITQAEIAETISMFNGAIARMRDLAERSDADTGGSVEPGPLSIDAPLLHEDIDNLESYFRAMILGERITARKATL